MSNKIIWEHRGVYWKYSGKVSGQEIIDATSPLYGDSRFDDLRYKLVDFLDAESIEINKDEVTLLACQHRVAALSNRNIKNAILVKPELSELADTFVAFFDDSPWTVQSFHNREEANNWLGREADTDNSLTNA